MRKNFIKVLLKKVDQSDKSFTSSFKKPKIHKNSISHFPFPQMESASELVEFPLLLTPIDSHYRACTIPYRFPSDNPRKATPTEISWINLFLNSIPSFKYVSMIFFI